MQFEYNMKMHIREDRLTLPISLETAWAFLSDPRNLLRITPKELNLVPVHEIPAEMYPGMIIRYQVRILPFISQNWVTEITHVKPLEYFVDEQRFGPYAFWHHQHHLKATSNGTEMFDIIHYALPFDPFSRYAHALLVKPQLDRIFSYRRESLQRIFPAR